jgi:superfamily II DNA or RNA helicase
MTVAPQRPSFSVGSIVRARGREWVVLPSDDAEVLRVRPLGGADADACGLYLPLEQDDIVSASLALPDPVYAGSGLSAALLRDAVRLGFRSAAGPLRSIARISVEPRPYQLVPLLMALRQDPVRLLIADDVGVGKTIEAGLIGRELLDRCEIQRLCVLCPPHLCAQWVAELREKFHIPAVEVRPATAPALGRDLPLDRSIFQEYPFTVVSIDFIKSDRRREQFIQTCPEFVIVDEAHAAAQGATAGRAQQLRHELLRDIMAQDPARHLVLVTATPHSGDAEAFASLVGLLAQDLEPAIAQLEFRAGTAARDRLAAMFVQRRRTDLAGYLHATTDFPQREYLGGHPDHPYRFTPAYDRLVGSVRAYTQELVRGSEGMTRFQQRLRWWAALALLRCVSSSPAAAAAALRVRAARSTTLDPAEADRLGHEAVFDLMARDERDVEQDDATPAVDTTEDDDTLQSPERQRLLRLARDAEALLGDADPKLKLAEGIVRELLRDKFSPIVFCRYLATAHYVAEQLRQRLKNVEVQAITGELPPEERAERIEALAFLGTPHATNSEKAELTATASLGPSSAQC